MDVVIGPDSIDPIIAAQISTANGKVVRFNIHSKVQDNMEFRTVDEDQIVDRGIGRGDQADQARTLRT